MAAFIGGVKVGGKIQGGPGAIKGGSPTVRTSINNKPLKHRKSTVIVGGRGFCTGEKGGGEKAWGKKGEKFGGEEEES